MYFDNFYNTPAYRPQAASAAQAGLESGAEDGQEEEEAEDDESDEDLNALNVVIAACNDFTCISKHIGCLHVYNLLKSTAKHVFLAEYNNKHTKGGRVGRGRGVRGARELRGGGL